MSERPPTVLHGVSTWRWILRYLHDPLECFIEVQRRYGALTAIGSPLPLYTGGRRFVLALGERYNRQVLGQPDLFRPGGQVLVGPRNSAQFRMRRGIFAMRGPMHRAHRRLMQPPFLKPAVAGYGPTMLHLIDSVIDRWQPGEPLDMYREMRTLSNWVAAYILFGNSDFAASIQIGKEIEQWLALDSEARRGFLWIDLPGTTYRRLLRQAERLEKLMVGAIERCRRVEPPGNDALTILIRAFEAGEPGMTPNVLIAHAAILYAASFETTANVLAWTLFLIAQHPAIAGQLQEEIACLKSWPPAMQLLDDLPLLDGAVRESLRLLPPVAYTFRTPTIAVDLDGFPVHPGDKVIISSFLTHRDPQVFPEPSRFNPARWLSAQPSPYEYMPFSAGPRLCLGQSFAFLELKLTVARIMQRFRVNVVPGSTIDAIVQLTLRPRQGIPMTVHKQDGSFAAGSISGNIHRMVDLRP